MNDLVFNTSMLFNTDNDNGCLKQIECDSFYIASYQRGYKWGNEHIQILFDDIYGAFKSSTNNKKSQEYYLQYITVKKIQDNGKKYLEIIDGQQRVTTLTILYSALNNMDIVKDKIKYAARDEVQAYIDEAIYKEYELESNWEDLIEKNDNYNEQDIYYMFLAQINFKKNIESEFKDNDNELKLFINYLKNNVKVIVNLVEEHVSSEQIFSNLNNNKIPLTNADLVKGLFLTKLARDNENSKSFKEILEKRASIGRQWDEMENWLNQEEIKDYYFKNYDSSMNGFLLLFIKVLKIEEQPNREKQYSIYNLIDNFIKNSEESIIEVFHRFKLLYSTLVDWYEDARIYNLIGFILLSKGSDSNKLIDFISYINKDRSAFIKTLNTAKNEIINYKNSEQLKELEYGSDNKEIHNILLALSIFGDKISEDRITTKFNFYAYTNKKQNWSLEHIFPQTPKFKEKLLTKEDIANINALSNKKTIEEFKKDLDKEFLEDLENEYGKLMLILKETSTQKITAVQVIIIEKLIQSNSSYSLHSIGNMALLSVGDNASMSNNMFNAKRLNLTKRVSKGSFIPKHTFDVFSKLIEVDEKTMNENLKLWTSDDIETHQKWIESRLKYMIGQEL